MSTPEQWTEEKKDGVWIVEFSSWRDFASYVIDKFSNTRYYIFRGQRSQNWLLETTLDRLLKKIQTDGEWLSSERIPRKEHLERFQLAARGRLVNTPEYKEENEWWALGQHHGLATPLLDWTKSPFVAAYFAFIGEDDSENITDYRMVYALSINLTQNKSDAIQLNHNGHGPPDIIEFFEPLSNENPRLVNQNGLFSKGCDYRNIESWVKDHFAGSKKSVLIKMSIPNRDRKECLQVLNSMNINHLTLFPDLFGTSKYCNLALRLIEAFKNHKEEMMGDIKEQKFYLNEEKEEYRLRFNYFWPPPPDGLRKGLKVNWEGNHYKVKDFRFEESAVVIILE